MANDDSCLCGTAKPYAQCCGLFLDGNLYPQTAETVMRSRYSAYYLMNIAHLLKTWHPDTRPQLSADVLADTQWQRLEVIQTKNGLKKSEVEFKAFYTEESDEKCLHERSLFKKLKGRWYYFDAIDN